jgi:murein DD-endopeptidase MepM/ murein hydrolase activator NlpD
MKKFYYFSEKNLKFVEIKDFKSKIVLFLATSTILIGSLLTGGYFLFTNYFSPDKEIASLRLENKALKSKLLELSTNYAEIKEELEGLSELSDDLRLAVNLRPLSPDEKKLGTGGSSIDISLDYLKLGKNLELSDAINYADEILRQFTFEKAQYTEITSKLDENRKLFEAIPAILPADGNYLKDSFGYRTHPILNQYKMHNGIDIIADIGTPIYAPGSGKVTFVGRKGGYGLTIEIDHGFGYNTIYAHLSKTNVKVGKYIKRGELIGKTGNTGLSSGPHLHYEVHHNGVVQDPMDFFFEDFNYFQKTTN